MAGRRPPRHMTSMSASETGAGIGVDAFGGQVIDPTLNVKELVALEVRRLDDLMGMQSRHLNEIMALRAEFSKELRESESARLDAIRLVDVSAVQRAAEVQASAAATLATAVQTSREDVRLQVAAAAAAQTEFVNKIVEPLAAALAAVQKFQYEQAGIRQQVVETRDTRGDSRGDRTTILLGIGLLLSILMPLILRAIG